MGRRVLFGAESFAATNSGVGRVARLSAKVLQECLREEGGEATFLALNDPAPCLEFGTRSRTAKGSRVRFILEAQRALLRHSHFMYDFLGVARAHNILPYPKRPALVWIHGVEVWAGAPQNRFDTAERMQSFVVNTNYSKQRACDRFSAFEKARVCWLATDSDVPVDMRSSVPSRPSLLILARMDEGGGYKGHRELIECWPEVVDAIPDAVLRIGSKGPGMELLQRLAARSPVASNIEFLGFIPEEDMDTLWQDTSIFAMPSRGEGFGIVYIEAMRQGVPVIGSIHDAASEVNVSGATGYNVDMDRPDELPARIIELLQDERLMLEMGEKGRQRWATHFTYQAFRRRFRPIVQEFLQSF